MLYPFTSFSKDFLLTYIFREKWLFPTDYSSNSFFQSKCSECFFFFFPPSFVPDAMLDAGNMVVNKNSL